MNGIATAEYEDPTLARAKLGLGQLRDADREMYG